MGNQKVTKEIIEGNKLIAEFMGKEFFAYNGNSSFSQGFKTYNECDKFITNNNLFGYFPELGWDIGLGYYHSKWDWLMPVAQKINIIDNYGYNLVIHACRTIITIPRQNNYILLETDTTVEHQIKAVYEAVVKFIKIYNQKHINEETK